MKFGGLLLVAVVYLAAIAMAGDIKVSLNRKVKHGQLMVDSTGRTRLFHGVNAVYKIPPFIPTATGWDTTTTLSEKDAEDLKKWGFNMVRLGCMWPGLMPKQDYFDSTYLDTVHQIVDALNKHGIMVLLDLHQDLGGRMLCGEGFPDWAVFPDAAKHEFPWPVFSKPFDKDDQGYPKLEECLKKSFGEYYITEAVGAAFQALFDNKNGIRDQFSAFWGKIAESFRDTPGVLGYEIINEPFIGDPWHDPSLLVPGHADKVNLYPMYMSAADAIRKNDNETLIFYEKAICNAIGPLGFPTVPGGDQYRDRSVYSWHNYCGTVDRSGNPLNFLICEGEQEVQWLQDLHDIDVTKCGAFLTEFGAVAGNNTKSLEDLEWVVDSADKVLQSWAYWQYKSYNDITTASNERESFYWSDGTLQTDKVDVLSRVYATAIEGVPTLMSYKRKARTFELEFEAHRSTSEDAATEIYVGAWTLRQNSDVKVDIVPSNAATYKLSQDRLTLYVKLSKDVPEGSKVRIDVKAI